MAKKLSIPTLISTLDGVTPSILQELKRSGATEALLEPIFLNRHALRRTIEQLTAA